MSNIYFFRGKAATGKTTIYKGQSSMKNKKKLLIIRIILSVLLIMTLILRQVHFIPDSVYPIIISLIAVVIIIGPDRLFK